MSLKNIFYLAAIGLLSFAVHAAAVSVGDWDFCSKQKPCSAGQGDCDSDDECQPGLKCTKDVGPSYGFDKGVDVCTSSSSSSSTSSTSSTSSSTSSGTFGGGVSSSTSSTSSSTSSTSSSTSSGNYGGGVSSSSSSSTSTSSTSSGTNPLDLLLSSSSSSTSSGTGGSASVGTCRTNPGSERYCADCGPCGENQGMCSNDSQCVTGLVCKNYYCVKP